VLRWKYRLGPTGEQEPQRWPLWLTAGRRKPGIASNAPTGFLESYRGIAGIAYAPPKARPSAVSRYMAETALFQSNMLFDPVDGSQSKIRSPLWSGAMRALAALSLYLSSLSLSLAS
jgi:hypothetical protein